MFYITNMMQKNKNILVSPVKDLLTDDESTASVDESYFPR